MQKVYVVGIGPGGEEMLTPQARRALEASDLLCGYTVYIDLVRLLFPQKPVYTTQMTGEVQRCRQALQEAQSGKTVALLCSGDPGVYGMAGLVLQLAPAYPEVAVEVVPGVTAATAGAALLGAPLTNDFAVISLSDRLTPWQTIVQRLRAAAEADFVLCLYNPESRSRKGYLKRACEVVAPFRVPQTPCGWARRIGREGEESGVCTFAALSDLAADMFTTVYIGNSQTRIFEGKLVTPRGYTL